MNMDLRVGEVIEASTDAFTAQAYRLYEAPPLGALVRAGSDSPVYGAVCYTTTRGIDPNRRPIARGEHLPDEASVYRDNPPLEHLLKTYPLPPLPRLRASPDVVASSLVPSPSYTSVS